MDTYKLFTVCAGVVKDGARIDPLKIEGAGITVPAVVVGETGRGRRQGVLPVGGAPMVPCPDAGRSGLWRDRPHCERCGVALIQAGRENYYHHPADGQVFGRLMAASIASTGRGVRMAYMVHTRPHTRSRRVISRHRTVPTGADCAPTGGLPSR